MKVGTKKKAIFYKVRATPSKATAQLREGSLRNQCYQCIKRHGRVGTHVSDVEATFDRPMRTTIHKLIESGHLEPIYQKKA